VRVWADVKKKHASHAITADVSLGETAAAVEFMLGDAVIVSGNATGEPPRAADVREAKSHCRLPVLLGSGVTAENVAEFYDAADGFIVGSYFKESGLWSNTVERARVERLADALRVLRGAGAGERRGA
jgi:predicted TIM-barrel enzyme